MQTKLSLRRAGLSDDPNAKDWTVHEDSRKESIGRIYQDPAATRPENRWFWSIYAMGTARSHVKTDARAATFEEAKRQFAEAWEAFKAWKPS
jgi:hypothetical protein